MRAAGKHGVSSLLGCFVQGSCVVSSEPLWQCCQALQCGQRHNRPCQCKETAACWCSAIKHLQVWD